MYKRQILLNNGKQAFTINRGMRIAQMVVAAVIIVAPIEVDDLGETERSTGGFGSTGL